MIRDFHYTWLDLHANFRPRFSPGFDDSSCKMLGTKRDGVVARAEITNGEKLGYVQRGDRAANSKDVGNGYIYHWRKDN